ncbi:MAG: LysR family transcriptional regulator, partial [Silicimonas sp.]
MKRPPPPLHLIRSFECAARHLSFTRAAGDLGYTQAAISTHIRALEQYVGRKLFVRRARSLVLTEIGEAFLP